MVIQYPGVRLLVYLECLFFQSNGVHETFKAALGGISGVLWLEKGMLAAMGEIPLPPPVFTGPC